jgi:uncharacterized protein (DUF58 family)
VVVLPFALLGALVPAGLTLSMIAVAFLLLLVLWDASFASRALRGISVELPEVVRMSKDRDSSIEVRIRNQSQRLRTLRFGLPLPPQIESSREDEIITLAGDTEWSKFSWQCRPQARGSYRLETACLEARSRLGFWSFRKQLPANSEIRVYPNLLTERRNLAALFLHRGFLGAHAQRQVGKGRDFEKLREYSPGDSFEEIYWKATARRAKPITKVFQIERTQEVYVIIDASRLSARSMGGAQKSGILARGSEETVKTIDLGAGRSHRPPKQGVNESTESGSILESFITAALILGLAAQQQGDLFGLLTFSDQIERFLRARNGKAHYSTCRDALYRLQPKVVTPDFDELCSFLRVRLRRRALLFFLTSLDDSVVAEGFVRNVELIRRQHLVMVNMLAPAGVAPVFSDVNAISVDEIYQHLGGHLLWQNLRELGKVLQRRGVHFSLLKNERLSADLVTQYLGVKQRQLL